MFQAHFYAILREREIDFEYFYLTYTKMLMDFGVIGV